jgi:hypothetical protein
MCNKRVCFTNDKGQINKESIKEKKKSWYLKNQNIIMFHFIIFVFYYIHLKIRIGNKFF